MLEEKEDLDLRGAINRSGIYQIVNLKNGKYYIGSAFHFGKRFVLHKHMLTKQKHHSSKLQRAWNKYGAGNFEFRILCECSQEDILIIEQIYLDRMKAFQQGYNCSPLARGGSGKLSRATKQKMSIAAQRVAADPTERQRRSERAKRQHAEGKFGRSTWSKGPDKEKISQGLRGSSRFQAHYAKLRLTQTSEEMSRRSYQRKMFRENM